jgi:hypothetical protein
MKLIEHVLLELRTVAGLLHKWSDHAEVQLLLHLGRVSKAVLEIQAVLRVVTPRHSLVLPLHQFLEVIVVFFKVYYHHRHIVTTICIRTTLVSNSLRYFLKWHALFPQFVNHFGDLLL